MKSVIQIVLVAVILFLGYLLYESIANPIRFQRAHDKRYAKVVERLIDIRNAQRAYKQIHNKYTGSFDTLIDFVKTDSFRIVKKEGERPDTISEYDAWKLGLIRRDTMMISMVDSLFPAPKSVDSMCIVPYSGGKKFKMAAAIIETGSKVKVPVFEAKTPNNVYLKGLDEQEIININVEQRRLNRYTGLKVGSLEETTNDAGNWEK